MDNMTKILISDDDIARCMKGMIKVSSANGLINLDIEDVSYLLQNNTRVKFSYGEYIGKIKRDKLGHMIDLMMQRKDLVAKEINDVIILFCADIALNDLVACVNEFQNKHQINNVLFYLEKQEIYQKTEIYLYVLCNEPDG